MAGSLALVPSKHAEKLATAIKDGWEVEFSRFFSYPPLASTCPHLVPLPPYLRNRRPLGTWITSKSSAWLQLIHGRSNACVILTVFLAGKIQVTTMLLLITLFFFNFNLWIFCLASEKTKENRNQFRRNCGSYAIDSLWIILSIINKFIKIFCL